jgi:MFS superfamily sulfate permease-like transporter
MTLALVVSIFISLLFLIVHQAEPQTIRVKREEVRDAPSDLP